MRAGLALLSLVLAACTGTTTAPTSTTVETPNATVAPTTTAAHLATEIDDCSAPQVTFSTLCETYELIEEWYVDRPADTDSLVEAALTGLASHETTETADPPRILICNLPDPAFTPLCEALAARVEQESIPVGPAIEAAVASMTDTTLGPFSYYVPPEQAESFRSNGVVGGVGVLLDATDAVGSRCTRITEACELTIVFVIEDNAGAEAGLLTDDTITDIDGESVDGMGFVDAVSRIAGDETGIVELTIDRNGTELDFSIVRAELTVPTVEADVFLDGVGYMRIPDFEDDIPELVDDGFELLGDDPLDTLIIDLRDNPGGYLDVAVDVLSEFVDGGILFTETDGIDDYSYSATEGGKGTEVKLIVLVNAGTASAAEVMAASLRDTRNAIIMGEPTFGKDAVQIGFQLDNGGEFYLAVSRWFPPSGETVGDGGLMPDVHLSFPAGVPVEDLIQSALDAAG